VHYGAKNPNNQHCVFRDDYLKKHIYSRAITQIIPNIAESGVKYQK